MRFNPVKPKKNPHRINEEILAREIRLIDEDKSQIGVISIEKAREIAREKELDLVEISPEAKPPVCRILNYGKFLYSLQKKAHEAQRHQRKIQIKEIKFTPGIGEHDSEVKLKKIQEFLGRGEQGQGDHLVAGPAEEETGTAGRDGQPDHGNPERDIRNRIDAQEGRIQLPYPNRTEKRRKRCQS